jgi:hypothetical protein
MNREQLAEKAKQYAGSVDEARWALAELALQAKTDGTVKEWAEVIGHVVRRSDRTVREWAQVAEFRQALGIALDLPISFYARALRAVDKVSAETLVELMDTAAAEGVTLETFGGQLDELCKPPDANQPLTRKQLEAWAAAWKAAAKRWRSLALVQQRQAGHYPTRTELAVAMARTLEIRQAQKAGEKIDQALGATVMQELPFGR